MIENEPVQTYSNFLDILRRSTDLLTDDPIRDEIFSVERLEQYATYLAREFKISSDPARGRSLLPEVKEIGEQLRGAYVSLSNITLGNQSTSPAADWFLDNFHIIEEQLWGIQRDLPKSFYFELPKLASGDLAGYPRIYAMALAILAHTDSRLDSEALKRFLQAYQLVAPLRIGELWAVSITLRIALIEHLKPLALRIVSARLKREQADVLADRLLKLAIETHVNSDELVRFLAREMGRPEDFDRAFVVQLTQRLRDQDPDVWPAVNWLETQLKTHHTNTVQVTQLEHHRQATALVTVGNIITSMRLLSALDWRDFFESVSAVDPILARDPTQTYSKMDFATRDRYRHAVERIAKRSQGSEIEVAEKAVELGNLACATLPSDERRAHIGYYLIDKGLSELETFFRYRPTLRESVSRWILRYPTYHYLFFISVLTAAVMIPVIKYYVLSSNLDILGCIGICFLAVILASEIALSFLNHYVTLILKPKLLPKMNTEFGIPENAKTLVVIPTLFTKANVVAELIERLEIHYLANSDPHIYFALLGDLSDADSETLKADAALLEAAHKGIENLNTKYWLTNKELRFFVFHRRRLWNPSENKWMGWERKRGKLLEFNRLLRGATDTTYLNPLSGDYADPGLLGQIKYVITLDSDTHLPRNCARRLVGTAVHPLNQPRYSLKQMRVTEGYGILQPRIGIDLASAGKTRFSSIFSGNIGLDPYTTAVSDVYQDLFSEGSFTGKGLYAVDAFAEALKNRGPENSVLSHDLFEGSYARAALVTDIELYDDYPSDYETFEKRQHRWVRGDWQLLPWLFPRVPDAQGQRVPNNLSIISRWKIFDNLRRSLVAPTSFLWLVLAWLAFPGSAFIWTLPVLLMLTFSIYAPFITGSFLKLRGFPLREHCRLGLEECRFKMKQIFLQVVFLPSQAWSQIDAICRSLFRKFISKKKLLEWITFAQIEQSHQVVSLFQAIFPGPLLAMIIFIAIEFIRPSSLATASPFLILWMIAPMTKRWSGVHSPSKFQPLGSDEIATYRRYARKTWNFFETFVGPKENGLAPDNFQEDPFEVVAYRTSPTNIGLQLLATASAYDFGYIGVLGFLERLEKTFETLGKLRGMHGHFFNWYDSRTLEPLHPSYISTVDSGNLAGHLIALKQTCLELSQRPFVNQNARLGLADTLHLLLDEVRSLNDISQTSGIVTLKQFIDLLENCLQLISSETWGAIKEKFQEAEDMLSTLTANQGHHGAKNFKDIRLWLNAALRQIAEFEQDLLEIQPADVTHRLKALIARCDEIVDGMNFRFLYNEQRKLFVIGYNVADAQYDHSCYDLLASESRLASFVAIAKGEVPEEHWFRLGRQITPAKGGPRALVAWTATMFEYLMPLLVMRRYGGTLLDKTYDAIVTRQIDYGRRRGVPWGVSESGYNARDLNLNYQYGAFGVPGLGLKRGLSDDLVISPYSTMLASMINPRAALSNLELLREKGAFSRYGFYESIDYTPRHLPENKSSVMIRMFMAHHQGMSLVSLNNLLHDSIMQRRFHAEPRVQATQLLLQERAPRFVTTFRPSIEHRHTEGRLKFSIISNPRFYSELDVSIPRTQILSNGNYSVMITSSGGGYSNSGQVSVNRFREDWTRDHWGNFIYIRDRKSGKLWSSGYQPTVSKPDAYNVIFAEDKVEFERVDEEITTHTEIIVSPEDPVELRRVSITNNSDEDQEFEITSYMEVVLTLPANDAAHPAFSNLFIQTEFVESQGALLASRRPRSKDDGSVWAFHVVVSEGELLGPLQYESDRSRFIGRGRSPIEPLVLKEGRPLSNSVGSVLDPIFSLRKCLRVPPGETRRLTFATGIASKREDALRLADKYHDIHTFARESEMAWTQSQVTLRHLNIASEKAHLYQRLGGRLIYSDPSLRPRSHALITNAKNQSSLWAYGLSGDLPIILSRISDEKDMAMVRELLHAHEYLRLKGLKIDLVILNERGQGYMQPLQDALQRQLRMSGSQALLDKPGGVFIRRADIIPETDVILLKSIARVVLSSEKGSLHEQLQRQAFENELPGPFIQTARRRIYSPTPTTLPALDFFNGLGGFAKNGESYKILLREGQNTPAPWVNVIANSRDFGFLISESGSGYTWSINSRENRLTTWSNDAITDPPSEAIYIRDEETGEYWTPTPLPIREAEPYLIEHGQGYTRFEHTSHGLLQELLAFVPMDASIKISRLRLKNLSSQKRTLSVTGFVEWVLGFDRATTAPSVITEVDPETGVIFAKNPYSIEFGSRVAFFDISEKSRSYTCDRKEFLGRNGSLSAPASLARAELSNRSGAGLDPCAAIQIHFSLDPGEEKVIHILLGQTDNAKAAQSLAMRYRAPPAVKSALEKVHSYWSKVLDEIKIKTPDSALDILVNRWLLYQTLSCRIWARSAFYQSGGAFGFRDQLQDVMALIYSEPEIARSQILRASERQFKEGDVQHWWHPPSGRGVRTRSSDDLLWLPYVVNFYLKVTGDRTILTEKTPFIEAAELMPGQDDSYIHPTVSEDLGSVLEHCIRAVDRSLKVGSHGLPLMGSGDWNDGMNRIGHQGLGESVWVGWFLCRILSEFIPICESEGEAAKGEIYRKHLESLNKAIEEKGWDGDWYRRAYFDDGAALGSASNQDCRIDSIVQSWSVLSGVGEPARAKKAMMAVDEYLIDHGSGLIKLFTPPFDKGPLDPGYIKGYVPGVRENGGQYTHAAIWTLMAYAALGNGDRAGELCTLINPVTHTATRAGVYKYKVEPYVIAADIYALDPHIGRGGWTWYTGSSSWMYRAALESILGFDLRGSELRIKPCIPKDWKSFEITYRRGKSQYNIFVAGAEGRTAAEGGSVRLDDRLLGSGVIPVIDDGKTHSVHIQL